jgi:hypothetical protein
MRKTKAIEDSEKKMRKWHSAKENPKGHSKVAIPNRTLIEFVSVQGFPFTNCFRRELAQNDDVLISL